MATFVVEFEQTVYTSVEVEAGNHDEAVHKAFKKAQETEPTRESDVDISSVYEKKGEGR